MVDTNFYKQMTLPSAPHEDIAEVAPTSIGPYTIDGIISKGGMSVIYFGRHPEKHTPVAIKTLSTHFLSHPELKERFLKESAIISITDHPNIVQLYSQGEWEQGLYIAMEFVQGISLRQFLKETQLSLKSVIDIVLQVAYALLHLHTHGVVHRDLKPENILITETGKIKVVDFGIAMLMDEKSDRRGPVMGTPSYMSPEQKENPRAATPQTDIYALGVIAYELFLGKLSYGVIQLELLPRNLRAIIQKATMANVAERTQDIVDLISELTSYLKGGLIDQDKDSSEFIKEHSESVAAAYNALFPLHPIQSAEIDYHVERSRFIDTSATFHSIYRFSNHSILIGVCKQTTPMQQPLPYNAMCQGIIFSYLQSITGQFSLNHFIETIGAHIHQASLPAYHASFVYIHLSQDLFQAVTCGNTFITHIPFGGTTRNISAQNPPLGTALSSSMELVEDAFLQGDLLVMSNSIASLESAIFSTFEAHKNFSLRKLLSLSISQIRDQMEDTEERNPLLLLAAQRMM